MPFFKLKKSRQKYNVLSKNAYVACVHLLDGQIMECTLESESTAQECLDSVLQRMEITQLTLFNLKFLNKSDQFMWVEQEKPLKKQLDKNAKDGLLQFAVIFYLPEPHKIADEMSRYQLFLQLRGDILDGRLLCTPEQAVRLAAYSIQVEFGDHIFEQHTPEYFSEFPLFPRTMMTSYDDHRLAVMTQEALALHQNFRGMSPTVAEIQYLREVSQLDDYGCEYYNAKDESGNTVVIGTCYKGLIMRNTGDQSGLLLKWKEIKSLGTNKRCLVVRTTLKEQPFNMALDDPEMAKYVWRQFVAQRKFALNVQSELSERPPIDGSTGAIPDIQQSVQSQLDSHDGGEELPVTVQYKQDMPQPILPAGESYYPPLPHEENHSALQFHDSTTNNAGSMYSLNQPSVVSHTPTGSFEQRRAALPAYRPSPDYHVVMQQRLAQQQAVAHQQPLPPPPVPSQRPLMQASPMITSSQPTMFADQEQQKSGDSEPLYANLDQYIQARKTADANLGSEEGTYANITNINSFAPPSRIEAYPAAQSIEAYTPTHPVDRSSSLIIQPTFEMPDLPPRTLCSSHFSSENMISNVLYNDYKPPPPYPRGSSSTPDLASQTVQHNKQRSDSPDLISRKHIAPVNQGVYRSVENLASDTVQLGLDNDQTIVDDDLSSEKSDATFHAKDSDDEDAAGQVNFYHGDVSPNSLEAEMIRDYLSSGIGYTNVPSSVYFSSQSVNVPEYTPSVANPTWPDVPQIIQPRDRSFSDTQVSYTGTSTTMTTSLSSISQSAVMPPTVELTASQESVASVVQMTASQECVKSAVYHSEPASPKSAEFAQVQERVPMVDDAEKQAEQEERVENVFVSDVPQVVPGAINVAPGAINVAPRCGTSMITSVQQELSEEEQVQQKPDSQPAPQQQKQQQQQSQEQQQVAEQALPPPLSQDQIPQEKSVDSASSVQPVNDTSAKSQAEVDAEALLREQVAAVKLRKAGPLRLAAMNGLVMSRTSIMLQQNDETRAPKDDRRGILETKLEEGQVFHEYQQIPRKPTNCDCTTGMLAENEDKNRFKDVLPYENNRVQLKPKKKNKSGYINASHMKVSVGANEYWYIATQAPLDNTTTDFWQMIWEQRTLVIAMMMELDSGKTKCATYWPQKPGSKHKLTFGDFQVVLQFTNSSMCYVTNTLILIHKPSRQERTIWHLQYTDWPEHGCPEDVYGFLSFLDEIESVQRHDSFDDELRHPIVVHCSAGVGRTGVVILCEIMKNCLEYNQPVDIPAMLTTLRDNRMYMVQTVGQYSFIYNTLITYLKNSRLI